MVRFNFRNFLNGVAIGVVVIAALASGALADRLFEIKPLDSIVSRRGQEAGVEQRIFSEESAVIDVVERVSPSVVTVSIELPQRRVLELDPFGGFRSRVEGGSPQDIGSGFIVSEDGLIITNKHVVSNTEAKYKVVTQDDREFEVQQINRDPANDLAILKIEVDDLKPVHLGSSEGLKVGQFVIAIGTALGEFRHTVTTGVISGLGRGIVAGSVFEGFVERLDDVIQTDAAINPGNSGGPLLNSAGQVIGVNVAVARGAENVGFAIPIDIVKSGLEQFRSNGSFASKPFLGVEYQMISEQSAILNEVPQGAFVVNVVEGGAAANAGVEVNDIITKINEESLSENDDELGGVIAKYKPGDRVELEVWRNLPAQAGGETHKLTATLSESSE